MPFSARLNADPVYVELTYAGNVTPADLLGALDEAGRLAREGQTIRFLADLTAMAVAHSITDLYDLIGLFESRGIPRDIREALVAPTLAATPDEVLFWETACINRGYRVRAFRDRATALAWLLGA